MIDPTEFRDYVSGRRRGAAADALRFVLRIAEWFYTAAVQWRNRRYDRDSAAQRVDAAVVSVGNLTLGGTGKSPLVQWIARWFHDRGVRVAVVSRGYGAAESGEENDEARELRWLLPDVPHLQNPDRVAAARKAIREFESRVIVLDDGFQHRRIARDFDIVLLDALEPFGFDHVFPRGTLREPVAGLRRADAVVLSRANLITLDQRATIWQTVNRYAPAAIRAEAIHAPRELLGADGREMPLETIRGQRVAVFCGIGNPAGFRHTLESCGCEIAGFREFSDHHRYTPEDVASLVQWSAGLGASAVICTCKDMVKLPPNGFGKLPLWGVRIEMEFLSGREALESRLKMLLNSQVSGKSQK